MSPGQTVSSGYGQKSPAGTSKASTADVSRKSHSHRRRSTALSATTPSWCFWLNVDNRLFGRIHLRTSRIHRQQPASVAGQVFDGIATLGIDTEQAPLDPVGDIRVVEAAGRVLERLADAARPSRSRRSWRIARSTPRSRPGRACPARSRRSRRAVVRRSCGRRCAGSSPRPRSDGMLFQTARANRFLVIHRFRSP